MTTRFSDSVRIAGDLSVVGNMPSIPRSGLTQDALAVYPIDLTAGVVHDAVQTPLPGTSAADDLGISGGTYGTNTVKLTVGDVKASTVTRYGRWCRVPLPPEYEDGETVRLRLSAAMETTVADTSATVDVEAFKVDREGLVDGSDLVTTAAQDINADLVFSDHDFVVTPSGLSAGDVLDVRITVAVVDGATATAVIASIGAMELLCDIRG